MRPLTDSVPKPLLVAGGKPLIVWQIERLAAAGFLDIVVNTAHLGSLIERALGDGADFGVKIRYSREKEALETAGGIANALELLGDEQFLAVNADIFCDYDYREIRGDLEGDLARLVLVGNPPHHPGGDFSLAGGRVGESGEKYTFSGIGVYSPELFSQVSRGQPMKLAPLLRQAMRENRVGGEYFDGLWVDVGTPERLAELDIFLKERA